MGEKRRERQGQRGRGRQTRDTQEEGKDTPRQHFYTPPSLATVAAGQPGQRWWADEKEQLTWLSDRSSG